MISTLLFCYAVALASKTSLWSTERLILEGNIVLDVGLIGHSDDKYIGKHGRVHFSEDKRGAGRYTSVKSVMTDKIYTINVGGDIGSSTNQNCI